MTYVHKGVGGLHSVESYMFELFLACALFGFCVWEKGVQYCIYVYIHRCSGCVWKRSIAYAYVHIGALCMGICGF